MFKLIYGTPRSELYRKTFLQKLDTIIAANEVPKGTLLIAVVFLGVKAFTGIRGIEGRKLIESPKDRFNKLELIKSLMTLLTPRQFMNVFPITKEYDGKRYYTKDYFFTREMVSALDMDKPIGNKIDDFLWDYRNVDTERFQLEVFGFDIEVSGIRRPQRGYVCNFIAALDVTARSTEQKRLSMYET